MVVRLDQLVSELSVVSATVLTHSDDINCLVSDSALGEVLHYRLALSESPSGVNLHSLWAVFWVSNTAKQL